MKTSILITLFDRVGTGWRSLESALEQDVPRSSYEVIVIVGGRSEHEAMDDPQARTLLGRADAVVSYPEDLDHVQNGMALYAAGARVSSGNVLFFMEGHNILKPHCCRLIAAHFAANPASRIVSAPFSEIAASEPSRLFKVLRERRAARGRDASPAFSLAGQTAVKRPLFDTLCEMSRRSGPFAETASRTFLDHSRISADSIPTPLSDHISNRSRDWITTRSLKNGRAHFDQFDVGALPAIPLNRMRSDLFACANRRGIAVLLFPIARMLGAVLLRAALGVSRVRAADPLALGLLVTGQRVLVIAGFCEARLAAGGGP